MGQFFKEEVFLSLPYPVVVYPVTIMEIIWAYKTVLIWISGLSLFFFLFSLAAVPWLVARIPESYFRDLAAGGKVKNEGDALPEKILARGLKNTVGLILVLAGIIMLFVPGQGLLAILAGLVLVEFPGKRRLVVFLVGQRSIQNGLNWIRRKKGVPPLAFPGEGEG